MIRYTQGNLIESEADALVNTVKTVGVSGKGIALMFKEAFPENFRAYQAECKAGRMVPGGLFVTKRHGMLAPHFIINFATKGFIPARSSAPDMTPRIGIVVAID